MKLSHGILIGVVLALLVWRYTLFVPSLEEDTRGQIRLVMLGPDTFREPMEAKISLFNRSNPYGQIKLEIMPTESEQKLNLMIASGESPDIWLTDFYKLPGFVSAKSITSLSGLISSNDLENILPVDGKLAGELKGQLYSIPILYNPIGLFINRSLFKECGIPTAQENRMDRQQFVEALKKIRREKGGAVFGCLVNYYFPNLLPWLWGAGANPFPPKGEISRLDSREVVDILTWLNTLIVKEKLLPNPEDIDRFGMPEWMLFKKQKAAMFVGRASLSMRLKDAEFKWDIIPVPGNPGARTVNVIAQVLVCRKQHEKDRLLGYSLKFLISPEFQDFFATFGVVVPSDKTVIQDKYLKDNGYPPLAKRQQLLNLVESGRLFIPPVRWKEINDLVIDPNLWKLYKSNPQEIENICRKMAKQADEILGGKDAS